MNGVGLAEIIKKVRGKLVCGGRTMTVHEHNKVIMEIEGLLRQHQKQQEKNTFLMPMMVTKDGKYRIINVKVCVIDTNEIVEFGTKEWTGVEEK
jgi:hypothetical protein